MRRGERMPRGLLADREDEVVKLIPEGHASQQIASILVISPELGTRDRADLTGYAVRAGLIEP